MVGIILFAVLTFSSGQQKNPYLKSHSLDWKYEHLRWIDPIDSTSTDSEILAVYYKANREQTILRIDFLEVDLEPKIALLIYLYSTAARDGLEFVILSEQVSYRSIGKEIPSSHPVRIMRNTAQDSIEIYFPSNLISHLGLNIQIEVTTQSIYNNKALLDQAGPINPYSPPPEAVQIGFVFENILSAATPAQALRSWDGAHSGPDSQRHGLRNLLRAIEAWEVPVCLPGLRSPETSRVLDFLGVSGMVDSNLYVADCNVGYAHFDFFHSQIEPDPVAGFSTHTIQEILKKYFSYPDSHQPLFITQVNLAQSKWGEFEAGSKAFQYIRQHPWLQPMNLHEYHVQDHTAFSLAIANLSDQIALAYLQTPENTARHMAREMLTYLTESDDNPRMELKSIYLGQVGHLLAAAAWAEQPRSISRCDQDIDWDGQIECILANENLFLTIEPQQASITTLFALTNQGLQQIVAPTWQFHAGLSDPSQWNLTTSEPTKADPGQMPGANFSLNHNFHFTPLPSSEVIEFASSDMAMRISMAMQPNSLQITYHTTNPATVSYGFLLDSWQFPTCQFCNLAAIIPLAPTPKSWGWVYDASLSHSAPTVLLSAESPLQVDTFADSRQYLSLPENPNFDYPRGHYLPIPFGLVQVRVPAGTSTIEISISTAPQPRIFLKPR